MLLRFWVISNIENAPLEKEHPSAPLKREIYTGCYLVEIT